MNTAERIAQIRHGRAEKAQAEWRRDADDAMSAKLARLEAEEAAAFGGDLTLMTRESMPRFEADLRAAQVSTSPIPGVPSLSADPDVAAAQRTAAALRTDVERQRLTVTLPDGTPFYLDPADAVGSATKFKAALHAIESKKAMERLAAFSLESAKAHTGGSGQTPSTRAAHGGFSARARELLHRMFTREQIEKMDRDIAAELAARADVGGAAANAELARLSKQAGITSETLAKYGPKA